MVVTGGESLLTVCWREIPHLLPLHAFTLCMTLLVKIVVWHNYDDHNSDPPLVSSLSTGSHDPGLTRTSAVPNTNIHSVEGSNPIWMSGFDNDWYKDEDSLRYQQFVWVWHGFFFCCFNFMIWVVFISWSFLLHTKQIIHKNHATPLVSISVGNNNHKFILMYSSTLHSTV